MYRIKLATGTVLEFDSLESLTVDIHAGVVDAEALIFHQRANQWLPIHVHPVWKQALAAPRKTPVSPTSRPDARGDGRTASTPRTAPKSSAAAPESRLPGTVAAAEGRGPLATSQGSAGTAMKSPAAARVASAAAASFAAKRTAAAPTATISAGPRVAAAQVSVDHLDEDLELLAPDELPAPASSAGATSAPAPAKPDAKTPDTTTAMAPGRPKLVIKTPATTAATIPTAAPAPVPPAAAAVPLLVEPVDENTELEVPAESDAAREPLVTEDVASEVPLDFIPVEPAVVESAVPAGPVAESTTPAASTASVTAARSEPVAGESVAEPAAPAEPVADSTAPTASTAAAAARSEPVAGMPVAPDAVVAAAPVATEVAAPAPTPLPAASRVIEHAVALEPLAIVEAGAVVVDPPAGRAAEAADAPAAFTLPTATMPRAAGSNRTLLYVGGAVAAAAIVSVVLLRGGKSGDAGSATESPRRTVNAAIPTAPLTPPAAELNDVGAAATDSIIALGRIEPPVVAAKPAAAARTPERRADEPAAAVKPPKPVKAAADTTPEIVAAPVAVGALTAPAPLEPTASLAPDVMASRYTAAHNAAWNDLVTRLRLAGFDNLFAPTRVAPSGAIGARATVAAARTHIAEWRKRAAAVEKAYRDSAATLVSRGVWSAGEQRAFEARATRSESGESAQRTNAILGASDRLFGILAVNTGTYEVGPDGLRFADSGPQREYWETRRTLVAAIGSAGTPAAQTPLQLVLKAIGGGRPPEGVNAN